MKIRTPIKRNEREIIEPPIFLQFCDTNVVNGNKSVEYVEGLLHGRFKLFFKRMHVFSTPPKWNFFGEDIAHKHWSEVSVNAIEGQDIKMTWELSRFHWFMQLLFAYETTGNKKYLETANTWFVDWANQNPVNKGANWVCAQEVSIRLIHVLTGISKLPISAIDMNLLIPFVVNHCKRIYPTIGYALGQDNNHGTSEAAGLYIGGCWLLTLEKLNSSTKKLAKSWREKGKRILEERIGKLVLEDGGFCMYSLTYHRVLLNTVSIVEYWRFKTNSCSFSVSYQNKCYQAALWLHKMTDPQNGDAPNLGTNDGSNPFLVQYSDYRDFRPSIQLASILFKNRKFYRDGSGANEAANYLVPSKVCRAIFYEPKLVSEQLGSSGIAILRSSGGAVHPNATVFVKYPRYQFRPSQCDLLHLDYWLDGVNILRDGGTYSYNCDQNMMKYFSGSKSHNTLEIDDVEPMPRISRFLLSSWRKMFFNSGVYQQSSSVLWKGAFEHYSGAKHKREIELKPTGLIVQDEFCSTLGKAILRWRLKPMGWLLRGDSVVSDKMVIRFSSDEAIKINLKRCFDSRYYQHIQDVFVVELEINAAKGKVTTHFEIMEK
ncbi:heparinase II/III family protein [Vibrio coralliilyticus]|uniref:heparinase II/III family protein n=1 Tax=Vibrio coralliilyticus TaxID=190893 RepID=UPI0017F16E81|nr:heparinase II/III family protein [Vibrio coralliilyticus]NUW68970.1 alginate lyase family protein [Vibrio coralliilyticus]